MTDTKISGLSAAAAAADADVFPIVHTAGTGPLKQTMSALKTYTSASPTLVTPNLGTPSAGVATNLTGTAAGLTAGSVTTNANLTGPITSTGNATAIGSQTGTGNKFVMDTNPVLVTPNIGTPSAGVATNLTGTAAGLTAGSVTTNANLTGPIASTGNATSITSQTGTGTKFVVDTSPTLVTPILGIAAATSVNKLTITTPATGSTLTILDGKTLTSNNSIILAAGADSQTFTFPSASDTVAGIGTAQTFSAAQTISKAGAASVSALQFTGVIQSGGTGTTNFPHLFIQPSGATASTTWSTTGTAIGVNLDIAAGNFLDFAVDGTSKFSVTNAGGVVASSTITSGGNLGLPAVNQVVWTARGIITSPAAGGIQLGSADAAAPVAQTLSSQSVVAGTTNTAGANTTVQASRGTGTGIGGNLIFKVAPAGTTGTAQNALVTAFTVHNSGAPILPSYTVATLPAAATIGAGGRAYVTDALTPTFGTTVTGGSSTGVPVYSDGTNWKVG